MSIDKNVGALSRHLNDIRLAPAYLGAKEGVHKALEKIPVVGKSIDKAIEITKDKIKYLLIPGIMFEELGFKYIGDINGHDIKLLVDIFNKVKEMKGPVLLHIYTVKGKGYKFSERLPCEYHGVSCFDLKTGKPMKSKEETYSDVFGKAMVEIAREN
ncbi:1-deoxy-D-xylulose-5-phosphate synthase [bioreactor metagenome]|uniref:1-deoxy-D-xylulose-5-phosphate synthase n=1 Tax=bioreactor metagenome TaxID=1076179 RepID=A0A645E353_9ZZZZ